MTRFSFSSLRARLLFLVLLAIIPALGLIIYTGAEMRKTASMEAQANALRLAQSVSGTQDDLFEGARQLLIALAQMPMVRRGNTAECNAVFANLLKQYPRYNNFVAAKPNGDVFCSAVPSSLHVNLADRPHFQAAVRTGDFAIGDYVVARLTGKAILGFSYPVHDAAGQLKAVLLVGLDLGWFNGLIAKTQLPPATTLTVIDRKGTILVRLPDPEKWVGKSMPESILVQVILSQGEGTAELPGMDSVPRLYGFTPLGNTGNAYVSVGVPKDVAFAAAHRILARNLVAFGIVAVFALVAAWFGSDLFILRHVNALAGATKRLSEGDLSARTEIPYGKGELSELARTFDQMAASMEQLITERKRSEQRLTSLHEINVAITSSLDLHAVLNVLMEKIDLFLPYTAVLVWLRNGEGGMWERAACWNLNEEEWKGRELRQTPSLVKAAVENKAPVMVENVQTDSRMLDPEFYRRHGLVSYLGVPLLVKGEGLGVLVFLTRERHQFTSEEVEFLTTLAGQAAMAIHNSQLYEQTKKQAVELERSNKVKGEFLSVMSHELRTPLNAVVGYAGMIQERFLGEINQEQEKALRKIIGQANELVGMISGILAATRIEAEAVKAAGHMVSLQDVLDEIRSVYAVPLNRESTLIWDLASDLPVVITDSEKLKHVLQNLINNAIKFTAKGNVTVSARYFPKGRKAEFKVADTGIGIPKDSLPIIFEMFRQLDGSDTRPYSGVGLGLYIVKKFTEILGGRVEVESVPGKGSTFTVTIPCEK